MKPNWRHLFEEARELLDKEVTAHAVHCGCRDPGWDEGVCPGVEENEAFLKKTKHLAKKVAE